MVWVVFKVVEIRKKGKKVRTIFREKLQKACKK